MHLTTLVFDDFIDDFASLEKHARSLSYDGELNPLDNVIYPHINSSVPANVAAEFRQKLAFVLGTTPANLHQSIPLSFRLTPAGTDAPHQAHTDVVMGQVNALLYFDDGTPDCGTSILEHESGLKTHPYDAEGQNLWKQDTNKYDKWKIVGMVQARKNRLAIIPSHLFHRAEPVGGFGSGPADGRLVLLGFFSIGQTK